MAQPKTNKADKENENSRVWWVNHGRTFSKAKEGGYLWAPMPVKGGNTFPHWESMTYVKPGDLILNFSGNNLVAFGIAKNSAAKFTEEAKSKNLAGKEGWRVDLDFFDFIEPVGFDEIKPYVEMMNQSIRENTPFNNFGGVNNGYLFNFSLLGIKLITDKFIDRIPEDILNYLELILDSDFLTYLRKDGLVYEPSVIRKYVLSLHTRSLVILSGKPGVGKTSLAVNYAKYLNEQKKVKTENTKDTGLFKRRWFKLSYNDKNVINAFDGVERKIDQVRATMLNNGLIPLGWDNRDLNQKKVIKEFKVGDVIIAYQGAYVIGGIGVVTHPHFMDEIGDAFDTFCESAQNFIRVEWIFYGPLRIKDFFFNEYDIPGFGMWVDTIHEMKKGQIFQFSKYLETKNIGLTTKKVEMIYKNYELVTVGADWQNRDGLFGKYTGAEGVYNKTKSLELIVNAGKSNDSGSSMPFFLILDEINMSKIDNYILELLTALESNEPVILHDNDEIEQDAGIPKELKIPSNLFIVGTMRADNNLGNLTSKVVDHANLIEIENMSIKDYLVQTKARSFNKDLPYPEDSEINRMGASEITEQMKDVVVDDPAEVNLNEKLLSDLEFFQIRLESFGVIVSLRCINEILKYMYTAWTFANQPGTWIDWAEDFDAQILQRILPLTENVHIKNPDLFKCLYCYCFPGKTEKQLEKLQEGKVVNELLALKWTDALYKGAAKKMSDILSSYDVKSH